MTVSPIALITAIAVELAWLCWHVAGLLLLSLSVSRQAFHGSRANTCHWSGVSKDSDAGKPSNSTAAQPSSGSSVPTSKSETTGPFYGPGTAKVPSSKGQQPNSQSVKSQPSSGSGLPTKKEETTGGRY